MFIETPISTRPTFRAAPDDEVDAQIRLLCRHHRMQGELRPHLLRYLVRIQREGRYAGQPRPIGKQILTEFYEYAINEFRIKRPRDPDVTGKKLVGELSNALDDYYDSGPGVNDRIIVRISGGRGFGYEPSVEIRAETRAETVTVRSSGTDVVSVTPEWDQARFDELIRRVERNSDEESDLWIVTTFFINYDAFRKTITECLTRTGGGLRIRIIVMNPANHALITAKFRIRADKWKPEKVVPALQEQIEWLVGLRQPAGRRTGTVEVKVSDLVPSGMVAHTRLWGIIGVMPATEPYLNGPMIEVSDPESAVWRQIDEDWQARWQDAAQPQPGLHYGVGGMTNAAAAGS
jgi:hypothetical protein